MNKNNDFSHRIPDIDIIDLEGDTREPATDIKTNSERESSEKETKRFPFFNIHIVLLAVFLLVVVCIFLKFRNWGERIDQADIESDTSNEYLDVLDQILPLTDENGRRIDTGDPETIVVFGNNPFSDDRDSEDNLANMIADATGATVYNCSISGSYLASRWSYFSAEGAPMDAYCLYWLTVLAAYGNNSSYYQQAAQALGDATPPEAQEVFDILTTLDFSTVDVAVIMYDATDYLQGHEMYDDANSTNIQYFTGNLEAGIELMQSLYPNIRIIVMSPTYAYGVDDNGEYISSDIKTYGQDVLSTYVIKEYASCASRMVTFVDHLYGTITEDNAKEYLTDNLHLNVAGRKKVLERFLYALNYYNQKE